MTGKIYKTFRDKYGTKFGFEGVFTWKRAREIFDSMKNLTATGKDEKKVVFGGVVGEALSKGQVKRARQKAAKEAAVVAAVAEEKALQKTSTEATSKKKRKAMELAACVEDGQKLKFCCYKCGSFFHRAKECIHWFGWIAWDAASDCGKLMGLKAKHNGAPTPPFENDKSLRWWLTLNKNSGFGEKVFQSHVKFLANGNKDNKHIGATVGEDEAASASSKVEQSLVNGQQIQKGIDYSSLFNTPVLEPEVFGNLVGASPEDPTTETRKLSLREVAIEVGDKFISGIPDSGAVLCYLVASLFKTLLDLFPESVRNKEAAEQNAHALDASGNKMQKLGTAELLCKFLDIGGVKRAIWVEFHVLQACILPVILGLKFMQTNRVMLNLNENGKETMIVRSAPGQQVFEVILRQARFSAEARDTILMGATILNAIVEVESPNLKIVNFEMLEVKEFEINGVNMKTHLVLKSLDSPMWRNDNRTTSSKEKSNGLHQRRSRSVWNHGGN
jgi:hypothetical protein